MTKKKSTKRALISSMLILAMCFTMLAGTTFAWFTDSVTSSNNIIKSGKLDMDVLYWNGQDWASLTANTKLFDDDALYEPGYTQVAYIKIANIGTLAFKYALSAKINSETAGVSATGEFKLSDVLMFGTVETNAIYATREAARQAAAANAKALKELNANNSGYLLAPVAPATSETGIIALVIYMPETVGNEANYTTTAPEINLGITVMANQYTYESDAFNDQYDANAGYTVSASAATAAELTTAIANAQAGDVIEITADITDSNVTIPDGVTILGNGHQVKANVTGDSNVKLVNVDSKGITVSNFSGTLEFDGGTLTTKSTTEGGDDYAPFSYLSGNNQGAGKEGTFIFKDMAVTAGATKGIKISKAKEVVIENCTFDAYAMDPDANGRFSDLRSLSMIDIQEKNEDSPMKVTIKNCTFIAAIQGTLTNNVADSDTAGAIKIKSEGQGFSSVTITGNTFTDCYRDIVAGVNLLRSGNGFNSYKKPELLKDAKNDASAWNISGNTTNAVASEVAARGVLIGSGSVGVKAITDTVGEIVGGAAIYNTYKTDKVSATMTAAEFDALLTA